MITSQGRETMSSSKQFCPTCGAKRSSTAKFCGSCGHPFSEKTDDDTLKKMTKTVEKAKETISQVESGVQSVESAVGKVQQVANFVVSPPAEWRVVIGELPEDIAGRLTGMGEDMVARSAEAARQKVEAAVSSKIEEVVKETVSPTPVQIRREELVPKSGTGENICPACGKPVKPGAKFCGSCGAKQEILPLCPRCGAPMKGGICEICNKAIMVNETPPPRICPHCGSPLGQQAKFCKSCGKSVA